MSKAEHPSTVFCQEFIQPLTKSHIPIRASFITC